MRNMYTRGVPRNDFVETVFFSDERGPKKVKRICKVLGEVLGEVKSSELFTSPNIIKIYNITTGRNTNNVQEVLIIFCVRHFHLRISILRFSSTLEFKNFLHIVY